MAEISIFVPVIVQASLSINPAVINSTLTLAVTVSEQWAAVQTSDFHSGEICAGEE